MGSRAGDRRMNPYIQRLYRIASELSDPTLGYELENNVHKLIAMRRTVSVVNPGFKSWEKHVEEMVMVLKSLQQEIKTALEKYDSAEEFANFFEGEVVQEEDELRKILNRSHELGKVASTGHTAGIGDFFKNMFKKLKKDQNDAESSGQEPAYSLDDASIDNFVEGQSDWKDAAHYVQQEYKENKDFFSGAQDVLHKMEKARHTPNKGALKQILDEIRDLLKTGQDMLKGVRKHLMTPSSDVDVESEVSNFEDTVETYIEVLRENLKDPEKLMQTLHDMFEDVGPMIGSNHTSSNKQLAARRVLPILIRVAHARPNMRPILLPVIKRATGRAA
jgi:hypothetical protein